MSAPDVDKDAAAQAEADAWNAAHPVGTLVTVRRLGRPEVVTKTVAPARNVCGAAVLSVEGFFGALPLSRLAPWPDEVEGVRP